MNIVTARAPSDTGLVFKNHTTTTLAEENMRSSAKKKNSLPCATQIIPRFVESLPYEGQRGFKREKLQTITRLTF